MAQRFHEKEFDEGTQVKLAVFRGYIREWIPVFLTARNAGHRHQVVNIFDFFAGPGSDVAETPGSPRIVQNELKTFCETHDELKASGVQVNLHFNDRISEQVEQLRERLKENACPRDCCKCHFTSMSFQDALAQEMRVMKRAGSANLVIMDQFGVKEVTPDIVNALAACATTDILFFISSSYIKRFASEPSIQRYFQLTAAELAASKYRSIHRYICEYFRSALPERVDCYLAPFSIKKGSNIYGVVFGTSSLRGLEKFLKVCWSLDATTGEANFDIDDDPIRYGQLSLFPEDNVPKKRSAFRRELEALLAKSTTGSPITNLDVYRFTLEKGFLPKHAKSDLEELQQAGKLEVKPLQAGQPSRKGAFYLNWKHYRDRNRRIMFRLKG